MSGNKLNPKETALVVIDMQNDFCTKGGGMDKRGYNITHARKVIPNIARMLKYCRDARIKIFHVRVENSTVTSSATWDDRPAARDDQKLGFRLIEPGSWGAEIVDELKPIQGEPVVVKTRYSAFVNTELPLFLTNCGIKNIIFTGATTNVCIETGARDAFVMDYNVIIASDCVSSPEPDLGEASLRTIGKYFGRVSTSDDIVNDLLIPQMTQSPN
ncbi:MAG: cysteine hydrolase [Nitrososphaerota archaeon]|nr:cysteine hydrolase [Nitrososphaerota archaeon]